MRPHPRGAETDPTRPRAWARCDRCGWQYNLYKLNWQYEWRGMQLQNLQILVCDTCLDDPQRQLGSIVLPPDPMPVMNARPEQYEIDETPVSTRVTENGRVRVILSNRTYPIERIIAPTNPGNIAHD